MYHKTKVNLIRSAKKPMYMMLAVSCALSISPLPVLGETTNKSFDIKKMVNTVVDIATQWPGDLDTSIADAASDSFPLPEILETTAANIASQSNDPWLAHVKTPEPKTEQEMKHPDRIQLDCMRFGPETYARFREVFGSSPDPISFFEDPETYQKATKFGVSSGGVLGIIFATLKYPKIHEAQAVLSCEIEVPVTVEQMRQGFLDLQSEFASLFPGESAMASGVNGEVWTPSNDNLDFVSLSFGGKKINTSFIDSFEMTWISSSSNGFDPSLDFRFMVLLFPGVS